MPDELLEVAFDSCILGSTSHVLVTTDGYTKLNKIPQGAWHCTGSPKTDSERCWDTVIRLSKLCEFPKIPQKYVTAMALAAPDLTTIPWSQVLRQDKYKEYFRSVLETVRCADPETLQYYCSVWKHADRLVKSLRTARVDSAALDRFIAESVHTSATLETFRPKGGYAPPIEYDRFKTVTGRLVVSSGPNILHMKKEHRHVILPSTPGGRIVYLDFSSLEARILLYTAGGSCEGRDLYTHIAERIGNGATRSAVKGAVLAELYGSSRNSLALALGLSNDELSRFIKSVRDVIDTRPLLERLKVQLSAEGYIRNKFGRKLEVQKPQDNILVNYYAQSTGVDVSLLGFNKIINDLGTDGIRPLFLLHDALILDVREDRLGDVETVKGVTVPGYEHTFPVKIEILQ